MPRTTARAPFDNFAEVLEQLGGIPSRRICVDPPPGKGTEKDVLRFLQASNKRLYELVDGVLVEKTMGILESYLAIALAKKVGMFLDANDLGFLTGADGAVRLMPHRIRIPDVSFIAWTQLPTREIPTKPIPDLAPYLAIEVLSESNTRGEMKRKLHDYFFTGVLLVWVVDPRKRIITVYTAPDEATVLTEEQTLDGGTVLPGFALAVREVFAGMPQSYGQPRKKSRNHKSSAPRE